MGTKDEFLQKMKAQYKEWQADIDKLKAKTEQAQAEARADYQKQLDSLRKMQDKAWDDFEELQNANEGAWDDMKAKVEQKWSEFGDAVNSTMAKFK